MQNIIIAIANRTARFTNTTRTTPAASDVTTTIANTDTTDTVTCADTIAYEDHLKAEYQGFGSIRRCDIMWVVSTIERIDRFGRPSQVK